MRAYRIALLIHHILLISISLCAQEVIQINKESFGVNHREFPLSDFDGWIYKSGNNIEWADANFNAEDWTLLKPTELTVNNADKNGRLEGWFRVKIKIDTSLLNTSFYLNKRSRDAADVYLNGQLIQSYGKIDNSKRSYESFIDNTLLPVPISLTPDSVYTIAVHTLDYTAMYPERLRGQMSGPYTFLDLGTQDYYNERKSFWEYDPIFKTLWLTAGILLSLLFWFLVFLNPTEKNIRMIAICATLSTLGSIGMTLINLGGLTFDQWRLSAAIMYLSIFAYLSFIPRAISQIFTGGISKILNYLTGLFLFIGLINVLVIWQILPMIIVAVGSFVLILLITLKNWKRVAGAQWAIVTGIVSTVLFISLLVSLVFLMQHRKYDIPVQVLNIVTTGVFLALPLSLLVYVAIRFKEIIEDVRKNANQVVKIAEEKKELLATQNTILEKQVSARTSELSQSLANLKATQSQLIQAEKMASLGELTAGIAHEIQNPLNFVNNFSEVNIELAEELEEDIIKGDLEEARAIIKDLKSNEEKINHHGKRADAIVKGMLQHSRSSTGQKEPTDINALCDEYLRLAYHGLRAKDSTFNSEFITEFDPDLPKVNVVPQDIGRVLLNLINNAFYAVNVKSQKSIEDYQPLVKIMTKRTSPFQGGSEGVEITVKDNGHGIPDSIKEKIFQPFFTTKPTGHGTGLGLSLSYDIVIAHGGTLEVESNEGEGTAFKITLKAQ